ncbi:HK97-gp10 family putative phage morphogenesis protein [Mesorhizobium sp. CO1-1-9]|uniref:HK97-gp10 family putative phage morphogenesis protein n=1 Tax=Mesorhizobium sp. CO1-1-9 TaxID=2876630 RepID=UPI001CCB0DFC|nr:HK97-gp10 family putative phage morphogenesis protein [Mesorhizobium sp. CO1-1-9]MBZ9694542.1 HK97 gp10 family phage protein [Mesorhizobium sp. CO1-1-9]
MASNGLKETLAAMERVKLAAKEAAMNRLIKGANDVADVQRRLAPKDTGALAESVAVTLPGHTTPPYSQPGGSRVAGENQVLVTAGDEDVRYAHLVEHGTSKMEAQPFFFTAYRLLRDNVKRGTASAFSRTAKKEWNRR